MNKQELALLEKAFCAEIDAEMNQGIHLLQTKAKLAEKMVNEGYLNRRVMQRNAGGLMITVTGYELTHQGRIAYRQSCPQIEY